MGMAIIGVACLHLLTWQCLLEVILAATAKEVNALLEMKHSFIDIEGSLRDWSSKNTSRVCEWTGITCNAHDNIQKIELTQMGLAGIVAPQVADLGFLEELMLNQNDLEGNLPNVMGLSRLRVIRMEANSFTGGFYFHDAYNWQSPLGKVLEEIWIDENEIHGTVESASPEVFSHSPIRVLRYGKQHFIGTIPSGYEGFPQLQDLRIGFNDFMGTVPSGWEDMKLKILYLPAMSNVCGTIPSMSSNPSITDKGSSYGTECPQTPDYYPDEVSTLLSLKAALDSSGSRILGTWSNSSRSHVCTGWIGITCDAYNHVTAIRLDGLSLQGYMLGDIKSLSYLKELSLMNNSLSGSLPDLSELRVRELRLTGNKLNGTSMLDDTAFWESDLAASLHQLWLDDNRFEGSFRGGGESIFWRSPMEDLRLNGNALIGKLPEGLEGIMRLQTLMLGGNQFTGMVPSGWTNLKNLVLLNLSDLSICGPLPDLQNTTSMVVQGSNIRKPCSGSDGPPASSLEMTPDEILSLRESLGQYLDDAHSLVENLLGRSTSQKDETLKRVLLTLATGFASLIFFSGIGWVLYKATAPPKNINADISKSGSSW